MSDNILDAILKKARGVLHVGAADGGEAEAYESHGLPVTWIEASPASYGRLLAHIAGFHRQTAIRSLITDRDGDARDFHVASNNGDSSSIFEMCYHPRAWPDISFKQVISMKTRSLDSLLAEGNFDGLDLLVLDLQGAELLALRGAERLLEQIRYVRCEAYGEEMYSGGADVADLVAFLKGHGFSDAGTRSWIGRTDDHSAPYTAYELVYAKEAQ